MIRLALFLLLMAIMASGQSQAPADIKKGDPAPRYQELNIPMTDGVMLSTDVYLPKTKKRCPTVLVRTPYGKYAEKWMGKAFGFFNIAVVVQDCRGRYKSGGEFYPFIHERVDGLETLKWIREQPWSDGTVAGWGSSYVGYTQWAVSDSLNFLTLVVTGANIYDFTYPDGLFSLQSAFTWGFQNDSAVSKSIPQDQLNAAFQMLPISSADDSVMNDIPYINDWIAHETYDDYWQKMDFRGNTDAPLISVAGWYDIFLKAQIEDFQALNANGNQDRRLIIGPFAHGSLGEFNEYGGSKKTGKPAKIFKYVKNQLKGKESRLTSPMKDTKYNLFIMEKNEYVGSDVWPPLETRITPFYIGPAMYLNPEKYDVPGNLYYEYAPADPFPSHGGTALGNGVGPARQNSNIDRPDQLVFETDELEESLILLGPVSATLWLSSDAPCSDFIVGLQDVFPDGKIINIQEGGTRVRFDNILPQRSEISVWATGYQVNPGHKLRVVISSSWFPRYNRSLNLCEPAFSATDMVNARQRIFYGTETPSSINLPIFNSSK
ncbi:MAG: CocE/NonD family hydrolase [Bacteroidales bacterium]